MRITFSKSQHYFFGNRIVCELVKDKVFLVFRSRNDPASFFDFEMFFLNDRDNDFFYFTKNNSMLHEKIVEMSISEAANYMKIEPLELEGLLQDFKTIIMDAGIKNPYVFETCETRLFYYFKKTLDSILFSEGDKVFVIEALEIKESPLTKQQIEDTFARIKSMMNPNDASENFLVEFYNNYNVVNKIKDLKITKHEVENLKIQKICGNISTRFFSRKKKREFKSIDGIRFSYKYGEYDKTVMLAKDEDKLFFINEYMWSSRKIKGHKFFIKDIFFDKKIGIDLEYYSSASDDREDFLTEIGLDMECFNNFICDIEFLSSCGFDISARSIYIKECFSGIIAKDNDLYVYRRNSGYERTRGCVNHIDAASERVLGILKGDEKVMSKKLESAKAIYRSKFPEVYGDDEI